MAFHDDLLEQAEHLTSREPRRPKQASLRRAISDAYYALFHMLISEASSLFVRDTRLANRINRAYSHADMDEVSRSFAQGKWPKTFDPVRGSFAVPASLRAVAQAFADLQQVRHDADYNLARAFTRNEARTAIAQAKQAFRDWQGVRRDDLARVYLACFLNWKAWDRTR
jgi:uncharacterized protein (UPF0332 family)